MPRNIIIKSSKNLKQLEKFVAYPTNENTWQWIQKTH